MITVEPLDIPDVKLVRTPVFPDPRGALEEPWAVGHFSGTALADVAFEQDLFSHNTVAGTVRGLHFQGPPHPQAKLIRVTSGAVFDVVVDLRSSSATFGTSVFVELRAGDGRAVFAPEGFAHGFCTLEDATCVAYKIAGAFAPDCASGIAWDDPDLDIAWPVGPDTAVMSDRDRALPSLQDLPPLFD